MMKPGTFLCIFMMNGLSFCNFNFKKYLINIHSVEKKNYYIESGSRFFDPYFNLFVVSI